MKNLYKAYQIAAVVILAAMVATPAAAQRACPDNVGRVVNVFSGLPFEVFPHKVKNYFGVKLETETGAHSYWYSLDGRVLDFNLNESGAAQMLLSTALMAWSTQAKVEVRTDGNCTGSNQAGTGGQSGQNVHWVDEWAFISILED